MSENKKGGGIPARIAGAMSAHRTAFACGVAAIAIACGLGVAWATHPQASQAHNDLARVEEPAQAESEADLDALLRSLSFMGADASVDPGQLELAAESGLVTVCESSDGTAEEVVSSAARRSAALASVLRGQRVDGADATGVTWVVRGSDGTARVAVSNDASSEAARMAEAVGDEPSLSDLVAASTGWAMDDATHDGLANIASDLPASGGEVPAEGNGNPYVNAQVDGEGDPQSSEASPDAEGGSPREGSTPAASTSQSASSASATPSGNASTGGAASDGSPSGNNAPNRPTASAHQHSWATRTVTDSAAWDEQVLVRAAYDSGERVGTIVVFSDGYTCKTSAEAAAYTKQQLSLGNNVSYTLKDDVRIVHHDAEYKTVHHDAATHTETYCTTCGATR